MPRIPSQLMNDQPGFYRSGYSTDTFYRANRIFGTEANLGVTLAPGNGVTGFGQLDAGTPLAKLEDGAYAGMYRPAGIADILAPSDGSTLALGSTKLFRAGDKVQVNRKRARGAVRSANAGPYALAAGLTLTFAVDDGQERTLTLAAGRAAIEGVSGPFDLQAPNKTLLIKSNRGAVQTVTIDAARLSGAPAGAAATAAEVALQISEQLVGGRARVTNSDKVTIETDRLGGGPNGPHIEVTGGTGATAVFGAGTVPEADATGSAADISAMTAAELAAFIEAGLDATDAVDAYVVGSRVEVCTDSADTGSIQCTGGTANAVVGFDTDEHESGADVVHGLTVVSLNGGAMLLDAAVRVEEGDLVRLDRDVVGSGAGPVAGILENTS